MDPEGSEPEHLLGELYSLIRIPSSSDQEVTEYDFDHQSLFDCLEDRRRCGELYITYRELDVFIWDAFVRACSSEFDFSFCLFHRINLISCCTEGSCENSVSYPDRFLEFSANLPYYVHVARGSNYSQVLPTTASADWWMSLAIAHEANASLWEGFKDVHNSVRAVLDSFPRV